MATTFAAQPISRAGFRGIASRLVGGVGFFSDPPYRYIVADSDTYRFDVVTRTANIAWSATVQALPTAFKAVINGGYFSGSFMYARAQTGVLDPKDIGSDGEVRKGGAVALPDDGKGGGFFFFGRDNASPPAYSAGGPGNPPGSVFEGMGGLGPLILPNPGTGKPLKSGIGNRYASDPAKLDIPKTPADFADLIQRNNNTYASIQGLSARGAGFCAVASIPSSKLLLAIIKPHEVLGDLDTLRDALFSVGCTLACFTDGNSSTCLAVNGVMEPGMTPSGTKDNLIETGFGLFLYKALPPTKVQVTFTQVRVVDDAAVFGSGTWTLTATVRGSKVTLLNQASVDTDDKISMSISTTVTVPSGVELDVVTAGLDTAGTNDDLGTQTAHFGAASSPPFGVGSHTLTTRFYEITFDIAIVP